MKFKSKKLAEEFLIKSGYTKHRNEWIGDRDCRTISELPSGMWAISGMQIPKRVER